MSRNTQRPFSLDRVIAFYDRNIQREIDDVKVVAWGSKRSQELRFLVLSQMANLHGSSLLDVGCGVGDLYGWLKKHRITVHYTGIDITPSMIEKARKKYPGAPFKMQQILTTRVRQPLYDYVVASGIFNRKIPRHTAFIRDTIRQMFLLCRKGMAFNILSTKADFKEPDEYHADPGVLLTECLTLTRHAVLRHDYMTHDFTIYLYKKK